LALRYWASNRFLLDVSSFVRQKGSSSGNERPAIQHNRWEKVASPWRPLPEPPWDQV
jgi:hypothetical protein